MIHMIKKIEEKRIGSITYQLKYFEGDNKYVIYKMDDRVINDGQIHRIPEEVVFDNEKDAREYMENLGK